MAEGFNIQGTNGVQGARAGVVPGAVAPSEPVASSAGAAATTPPAADGQPTTLQSSTTFTTQPAPEVPGTSRVVQRLIDQNATLYAPGLAQIPVPPRPEGVERQVPKKAPGPMGTPRTLDAGASPLAPATLADARQSVDVLGTVPDASGETTVVDLAAAGAGKLPSRHGLVAYTTTEAGNKVYLTQERWLHIKENHMEGAPQPRGKRTTTYWPTQNAVDQPTMQDADVIGVIVDTARKGQLRTEVRDTRMAEYDLPAEQAQAFGVSEAKVSMAPDGLVLSAYPGAGDNVLAVYEVTPEDQAALASAQATTYGAQASDERLFQTNVASTTFG